METLFIHPHLPCQVLAFWSTVAIIIKPAHMSITLLGLPHTFTWAQANIVYIKKQYIKKGNNVKEDINCIEYLALYFWTFPKSPGHISNVNGKVLLLNSRTSHANPCYWSSGLDNADILGKGWTTGSYCSLLDVPEYLCLCPSINYSSK